MNDAAACLPSPPGGAAAGSHLDPAIARRFAWAHDHSVQEIAESPILGGRLAESYRSVLPYHPPELSVETTMVTAAPAAKPVTVRIYQPDDQKPGTPALVWAHGGGFASGDLDGLEADAVAREVAQRSGGTVVSVGYDHANGERSHPELHQEVAAAYLWTQMNAGRLGANATRIMLGGASAGASLALSATSLVINDGYAPSGVILVYPVVYRELTPWATLPDLSAIPSVLRFNPQSYAQMIDAYSGGGAHEIAPPADRLARFPRTLIVTSEYDDLRPSGELLARKLDDAGVDVDYRVAQGAPHGHLAMSPDIPVTAATLTKMARFLSA